MINHEGKYSNCGHYNWYVKSRDENWYICDDAKIKRIYDITDVPTSKAYILFYRLKGGSVTHQLITRRPSNVSTEDLESETLSVSSDDSNNHSIVKRKRRKGLKCTKPKTQKKWATKKRRLIKCMVKKSEMKSASKSNPSLK